MIKAILGVFGVLVFAPIIVFTQQLQNGPLASIDLTSSAGTDIVKGTWRYSDVKINTVAFRGPDADGQPTGSTVETYDIYPHAGGSQFDDSAWPVIRPEELKNRRGNGRVSFNWYRINLTVPEIADGKPTLGTTVVFETSVDDYAEVWVDGEIARYQGQNGGSVVAGWNAKNRVVIGRDVRPGQVISVAIFGINGPISNAPTNFIWVREAKIEFLAGDSGPKAISPREVNVGIESNEASFESIVGPNPKLYKIAEGFKFTEGPVWVGDGLLFSDPNSNTIYKYTDKDGIKVFRRPSGYDGADIANYGQPGSNGLTLDPNGRLTINQHGNRRVVRLGDRGEEVLADKYEGKRLNSPNDLVYRSDGTLFFTDPPFGLPKAYDDPNFDLKFSGVYSIKDGNLRLLTKEFKGPNGIALSPDEKFLYVGNWDEKNSVVYKFPLNPDGTVGKGALFYNLTDQTKENSIDGIKVDSAGNVYVAGPGGLWVFSPNGKHLGTIVAPKPIHNMAWGGDDYKTLYICARDGLYRMPLNITGIHLNQTK